MTLGDEGRGHRQWNRWVRGSWAYRRIVDMTNVSQGTLLSFLGCKGNGGEMHFQTCELLLMYLYNKVDLVDLDRILFFWTTLQRLRVSRNTYCVDCSFSSLVAGTWWKGALSGPLFRKQHTEMGKYIYIYWCIHVEEPQRETSIALANMVISYSSYPAKLHPAMISMLSMGVGEEEEELFLFWFNFYLVLFWGV